MRIAVPTTGLPSRWTGERTLACAGAHPEKHGAAARGKSDEAVQVERRKRDMEPDERPRDRETERPRWQRLRLENLSEP